YGELFAALPLALRTDNRVFVSHSLPSARRQEQFDPAVLEREETDPTDLQPGGAASARRWGRATGLPTPEPSRRKVAAALRCPGLYAGVTPPACQPASVSRGGQTVLSSAGGSCPDGSRTIRSLRPSRRRGLREPAARGRGVFNPRFGAGCFTTGLRGSRAGRVA